MSLAIIAITTHGLTVAGKLQDNLKGDLYAPENIINDNNANITAYETTTKKLIEKIWSRYNSFIFIMALGIVSRIIKDQIENKFKDPAIVVVDEMGRYAISTLSGHEGGANRLAEKVALICRGDFVITTGSEATKTLIAGMGCRRGTPADQLEETLREGLKRINRTVNEVRLIASVEDKEDEEGFHQLSEKLKIPLKFISKSRIKTIEDNFSKSETVKKALGIYSVAEPCAILGGFRCQIVLPKTKLPQTTIAIAEEKFL
ncbi:MAG TPA: cobalamin biosynthesis protein [Nitrospinota bacterium]|jgi:cobalt-precorrin 5A hydrolase|nr:cobalamin biosynthesis protein [Nitrospinota bacterium]